LHFGCTKSPKTRLVATNALSIWDSWGWGGAIAPSPPGYAYAAKKTGTLFGGTKEKCWLEGV